MAGTNVALIKSLLSKRNTANKMLADIHIHSEFSFDSNEKPENFLAAVKSKGANVIGFSEHYDYDAVIDGAAITVADLIAYCKSTEELKRVFSDSKILFGIEFGYRDFAVEKYKQLIKEYDFDYVINSVHTLAGRGDCFHDKFFAGKPLKESYRDYFVAVLESIKADFDYQIIGHLGYVSRYRTGEDAQIFYKDFSDIIDEILKEIIKRDKCLEINTSTGKSKNRFLPDTEIIERYLKLGGSKLSFGSDAHSANDCLRKSEEVVSALKKLGVIKLYYYEKRKAIAYNL